MKKEFKEALEDSPIIAAIKDDAGLTRCLDCDSQIIFILYGDIITIPSIVEKVKGSGKLAFVHMDLVNGLSSREISVDYIRKETNADGIISTKQPQIRRSGKSEKPYAIWQAVWQAVRQTVRHGSVKRLIDTGDGVWYNRFDTNQNAKRNQLILI